MSPHDGPFIYRKYVLRHGTKTLLDMTPEELREVIQSQDHSITYYCEREAQYQRLLHGLGFVFDETLDPRRQRRSEKAA